MEATTPEKAVSDNSVYEVGYLIVPSVAESDTAAVVEDLKKILAKAGMEVISEEAPKLIQLAYTMARSEAGRREKFSSAYFGWVKFEGAKSGIADIEAALQKNRSILRSLVMTTVRETTYSPNMLLSSDRLEGETIKKREVVEAGKGKVVSQEELDKSIDALVAE